MHAKSFGRALVALALVLGASTVTAQAQTATLTITTDGVVSGAVGAQGPGGNVCNPNPGGGPGGGTCVFTYPVNTPLRIAANSPNPDPGFLHSGTGDAAACSTSICNIVLTTDSSISATFDASQGPVASIQTTLLGDGKGNVGIDNQQCQNFELGYTACTTYYAAGSEVRLQGRSMPGNLFVTFSGGAGDTSVCGANGLCQFTATGNSSVNATFSAMVSVAITPGTANINVGNNAPFNARATFTNGMTRLGVGGNTPWQNHVQMDVARFSLAAASVNDLLYAFGGVDGSCLSSPCAFGPLNTVEAFNPLVTAIAQFDQAWTQRAPMTTPREGLAGVVVNGKIYAIGGHTTGGSAVASMEFYDPATNAWSARASMSGPRAGMAAAAINTTIFVAGGSPSAGGDPSVPLATVEAYDASIDSWTMKPPMLTPRVGAGAAAVNGTLYVIGGDASGTVEAFDPATDTWSTKATMPSGGGSYRVVALNGLIYAVGGPSGAVKVYNPAVNAWATIGSMPSVRGQFGLAVLDGRLFAAGGMLADQTAVATLSANRPPESTWWSSNNAVGRINSGNNGNVNGVAAGTATISARLVGIDSGAESALLTVTSGGGGGSTIFLSVPTDPPSPPNPPGGSAVFTMVGQPNWGCGTFGQNAVGPWEVKINYGDGSGDHVTPYSPPPGSCGGGPGTKGVFFFDHAYSSPGVFPVTVTVRNTATNESTTRGFHVEVQADNGGGDEDCTQVISDIAVIGSVPFDRVQVAVFDRATNELLFEGELPLGHFDEAGLPEGQYRIEFSVPAGYMVTPSIFNVDAVCGEEAHLNATVQAIPTVPPTIALTLSPNVIWPPNNKMVPVAAAITASSPNGHATTVVLVSITSNEAVAGDIAGASVGTDDRAFEVRAKKDRIYTVTYRATDTVTGLSTLISGTILVPHDQGK